MKRLVITRSAFKDLTAIWHYIAEDSIDAADRVRDEFEQAFKQLAETPGIGHQRRDVAIKSYRFWRVYSYMIAYRVHGETLHISRVVHGAQNFRRLFRKRRRWR
jgi:addiction module RelE/StbE family toxin